MGSTNGKSVSFSIEKKVEQYVKECMEKCNLAQMEIIYEEGILGSLMP